MTGPALSDLVDALLLAAETGDISRVEASIDDISSRLYRVPAASIVDPATVARMHQRATPPTDEAGLAVGALAILAQWHLNSSTEDLAAAMSTWVTEAARQAQTWNLETDAEAIVSLAHSTHALGTLLGIINAEPTHATNLLARAARALLLLASGPKEHRQEPVRSPPGVPADVPHEALKLVLTAFAWRAATGIPTDDIAPVLSQAVAAVLDPTSVQYRPPDTRLVKALELLGRDGDAQNARAWLLNALVAEGRTQDIETLVEALCQPPIWPGQIEHVRQMEIRILLQRGQLGEAAKRCSAMLDESDPGTRKQLTPLAALVASQGRHWAEANFLIAPLIQPFLTGPPQPEPGATAVVDHLILAARCALETGNTEAFLALHDRLRVYEPMSIQATLSLPLLDGIAANKRDDPAAAISAFTTALALTRTAIDHIESGQTLHKRVITQGLTQQTAWLCGSLGEAHLRRNEAREALEAMEIFRAEFLRAANLMGQVIPPGVYAGLANFLDIATQRLPAGTDEQSIAARTAAQEAILHLRKEPLSDLLNTSSLGPASEADFATVLAAAGTNGCVVSVNFTDESICVVATDGTAFLGERLDLPHPSLERELIATFTRATTPGPSPENSAWRRQATSALTTLATLVGAPIRRLTNRLGRGDVILSTTGVLSGLPWTAIGTESSGTLLDHLNSLTIVPGISAAAQTFEITPNRRRGGVLIATPQDPTIPMAAFETHLVERIWTATGRIPTTLTHLNQPDLVTAVGSAAVIHIAAHARWNTTDIIDSGISVAGGHLDSGELLRALDVAGADLLILSACDTAASSFAPGGDAVNLAQIMLCAGARQALASLWKVEDFATTLLMNHVHSLLADGTPAAPALLAAQRAMRDLTHTEGCAILQQWAACDPPPEVGYRLERWRLEEPTTRPMANPLDWSPFVCYGPPPTHITQERA